MDNYLEELKKIITAQFGIPEDTIEESSLLDEDLSITDLDLEDLISQIESKYDIKIPPQEASSFKKVADIVSYLYDHVAASI